MKPVKLLGSKNILVGIALLSVAFIAIVLLQTRSGASETLPGAERFARPPAATGEVVSLATVRAAYQRNRTTALRQYRKSPIGAQVHAVTPVNKNGWAAAVALDGGVATAYFADRDWQGISPVAVGQTMTVTCADWQSGAGGTVTMYGCGVVR